MNIPCTQGDRIHIYIYIYINHYDENLLNIFLICFLKSSVRDSKRMLKAYTNGGRQDSKQVGDLLRFFTVWYNPQSMLNIFA